MGQSTNAILCYGIDIGEDGGELASRGFLDDIDDYDDLIDEVTGRLLAAAGFTEPEPGREDPGWAAWCRRRFAAEERLPVELVAHCSDRSPMYILTVRPVYVAGRGRPATIDLLSWPGGNHAERALTEALAVLGWVPTTHAAWLLASYWV